MTDRPSRERDTIPSPPDYSQMTDREVLLAVANRQFEMGVMLGLIGHQLTTGDSDPRTIAERLQSAENDAAYCRERLDFLVGRLGSVEQRQDDHEQTPVNNAHPTFHDLHDQERQRRAARGGE